MSGQTRAPHKVGFTLNRPRMSDSSVTFPGVWGPVYGVCCNMFKFTWYSMTFSRLERFFDHVINPEFYGVI